MIRQPGKTTLAITLAGALAVAGCVGMAAAQERSETAAAIDSAPAQPAPPPGMPQPITLADRPGATGGEALYVDKCIMCHGPVGMGTGLLERRGRSHAELEKRGDLAAAFVVLAARNGIGNMPAIPRGEVSDEQLQEIADYLAAGPHGGDR
ncbi:cytochrome c [Aurantiacibacter xanthus]|uniref:Cytochrome c n=1 Tax=Aurantiacibacter xanthus TaxID=1784712 RepID=A0A3A1P4R4_9SPHN|nr:cytochrome c [Aurantiacibacter xanthus]RIV88123.1 cytochrome c [Aurantiacibacter xanthus]